MISERILHKKQSGFCMQKRWEVHNMQNQNQNQNLTDLEPKRIIQ